MRAAVALLVPLLAVLGAIAWGATELVQRTNRDWFDRDTRLRAELAIAGSRQALSAALRARDAGKARRALSELSADERVVSVLACDGAGELVASSPRHPIPVGCAAVQARVPWEGTGGPWHFQAAGTEARLHVTAVPLGDDEGPLGVVALVHDMAWVDRRESETRRSLGVAFGIVALAAAVATTLSARFSWRTWNEEVRGLLRALRFPAHLGEPTPRAGRRFQPLLSDVRALVSQLAVEQAEGRAGVWSPERLQDALARHLPGSEVIVVANREPFIHERLPDGTLRVKRPASGLVTALEPVMDACSGTWIAHGSGSADRAVVDRHDRVAVPPDDPSYTLRRVWLTSEEEEGYYYGLSNEGLWPLCHMVHTRPDFRSEDWRTYREVNERFAEAVCREARGPDPVVLVQDYHFALLPRLVRERLPGATIITFWHIPWPSAERFSICPFGAELLEGMLGSSILGFQVQADCNNFQEAVDRFLEARIDRERQSVVLGGEESLVRAYPISVDWPSRWAEEAPPVETCRTELRRALGLAPDALLGVGIDRLDYTKGIEERFLAVERLLERFPRFRGRFTFAQLAAPSRTRIARYQELDRSVEALVERINGRFGSGTWRPIVLLRENHEPPMVFRAYRAADLCYVSSLHDGMNLVAKEFVAARDDESGVLVLSRFTGAARELSEALLVNPYDLDEASAALAAALTMPAEERRARMRALRNLVAEFNVYRWAGRMLVDGGRLRRRDRVKGRLTVPLRPVPEPAARR